MSTRTNEWGEDRASSNLGCPNWRTRCIAGNRAERLWRSLTWAQRATIRALTPYVVRAGDETGFSINGTPKLFSTAASWVAGDANAKAEAAHLQEEGFRAALSASTSTVSGNPGLSFVLELGSHASALSEERAQLKADMAENSPAKITRITSNHAPTSEGFTAKGKFGAANLLFVEGRCVLLVGDAIKGGATNISPVLAGAFRIYARTNSSGGACG